MRWKTEKIKPYRSYWWFCIIPFTYGDITYWWEWLYIHEYLVTDFDDNEYWEVYAVFTKDKGTDDE